MSTDLLDSNYYPLELKFKIGTIHNDFIATDALGNTRAFVKQKLFKFKEHVNVFSDENQHKLTFEIKANKWLDFNTSYSFTNASGAHVGRVVRKGWKSLWKSHYIIFDEHDQTDLVINEKNAWVKVWDSVLSGIPIAGLFAGYLFNPSYLVTRPDGTILCILKKQASFFGRKFSLSLEADFEQGEEDRVLLSVMMMVLLERRRG